jgi:two-component system CheB/CheR fusion protein
VVGCSTGEEAYSIAILLQERMEALRQSWIVQVFATDIDSRAIAVARSGVYPASVVTDISAQRLARFFALMPDGTSYRVHKSIRDMLVFSEHDLNKDPPFSRVDLISCRNLLIYLGPELQKKIIPTFHYALNAQGMLFLGTSEGVGDFLDLFSVLERKAKLYLRRDAHPVPPQLPRSGPPRPTVAAPAERTPSQRRRPKSVASGKLSLHELTEQALLRHMASTAVLVDARGDILYLHGRTGMYLELPPGEALANNIIKLSREGLRHALTVALHKAVAQSAPVHVAGLQVRTNGDFTTVNLSVSAVEHDGDASASLYLVVLDEVATAAAGALPAPSEMPALVGTQPADATIVAAQARIAALQEEMRAKDEYLQTTQEELESANEELKSSNEEMQSVNEELQSTNEELETSKEELQSVNEELSTVNAELQTKVLDLQRANNDMNNLLAGTGIATVFVDHALRILRFTPNASLLINLIQADVGRPVSHIVSNLIGYDRLVADAQSVLDNLIPVEVEVQTRAGRWYTMRIQPYRTLENVIEGAVITFVDVSDTVQTRQALRAANERIQSAGPRG